jgi:hypothetical protein
MFIRYRKLESGGRRPKGVVARIACHGLCEPFHRPGFHTRRAGQCPMKPRCRWRIGADLEELALVPYRLQVSIVENRRVEGKVRQQHVADLGSIDAWLIPEFWVGVDPMIIGKVRADDWDLRSVRARVAFWETANPRLARLANRLDPKSIRMAIHTRIPWPKQPERELVDARADFRFWRSLHSQSAKMIEANDRVIEAANKEKSGFHEQAANAAEWAARAAERLALLDRQGGEP